MNFFSQTAVVHIWVVWLLAFVVVLSATQNIMRIVERHCEKKLERKKREIRQ